MKFPILIKTLFLALLFVSGSALAEWQFVGKHPQGDMYIDLATVRKDGNMRTYWKKIEYKTRGNQAGMSMRAKEEIDCKKEASRTLALAGFTEPNLGGEMIASADYPNEPFSAIAPDTMISLLMQRVCK